jgi:hypothetical protein
MTDLASDPAIRAEIEEIVKLYANDLYGYRRDVLHRDHEDWQKEVGLAVQQTKRNAISSGHGIGKTGFLADVIHWFISTRPRPAIVATAGTEQQLSTKLWRELLRVNNMAENRKWFSWKAKTFSMFGDATQQANAIPWSEENPHAFAGTHEDHVLGVFDEGSTIVRSIYNTFAGAMSTDGARWLVAGNPTESEGYFFDICHGKLVGKRESDFERGMWRAHVIGCAQSTRVSPSYIEEMRSEHGEDSDEYRIRVLGLPPRQSVQQFIGAEILDKAKAREVPLFERWPLVIGADVGRGDRSVLVPRRGRKVLDAIHVLTGSRTTDFARMIAEEIKFWRDDKGLHANVVIEELGMGVGVVETLEDLGFGDHVWGVNTGAAAQQPELYTNLRCEMWGELKAWLEGNVEIPNRPDLIEDLLTIRKKPSSSGKLRLETKEEMRKRGLKSPDVGDALALTFAVPFDLLPEKRDKWGDEWGAPASAGGTWMGA